MSKKLNPKERMIETLSNAFISPDAWNPQEYVTFWAIKEGFYRASELQGDYSIRRATKKHECIRNCVIKAKDMYFVGTYSWTGIKICASCMAMILYFRRVWNLPVYQYDYWDDEKHEPHLDENSSHWKAMQDMVENS